jgi:O-antigen ligase
MELCFRLQYWRAARLAIDESPLFGTQLAGRSDYLGRDRRSFDSNGFARQYFCSLGQ